MTYNIANDLILANCTFSNNLVNTGPISYFISNMEDNKTVSLDRVIVGHGLVIDGCALQNNEAIGEGRCIFGTGGEVYSSNSSIISNVADGGIISWGHCRWILEDDLLSNNTALNSQCVLNFTGVSKLYPPSKGGPKHIYGDHKKGSNSSDMGLIVKNCTFLNNKGFSGQYGLSVFSAIGNILLDSCEFHSNIDVQGACTVAVGGDAVVVSNRTISDNIATKSGISSGLWVDGSNASVDQCIISNNQYLSIYLEVLESQD